MNSFLSTYFTIEESCRVKPWPKCELGMHFMKKWEKYNEKLDEVPPSTFCGTKEDWLAEVSRRRLKAQATTRTKKKQ